MKTTDGYTVTPEHIPSSRGGFGQLHIAHAGFLNLTVYPLTIANLRELACELAHVAYQMELAQADDMRVSNAVRDAMWEAA